MRTLTCERTHYEHELGLTTACAYIRLDIEGLVTGEWVVNVNKLHAESR